MSGTRSGKIQGSSVPEAVEQPVAKKAKHRPPMFSDAMKIESLQLQMAQTKTKVPADIKKRNFCQLTNLFQLTQALVIQRATIGSIDPCFPLIGLDYAFTKGQLTQVIGEGGPLSDASIIKLGLYVDIRKLNPEHVLDYEDCYLFLQHVHQAGGYLIGHQSFKGPTATNIEILIIPIMEILSLIKKPTRMIKAANFAFKMLVALTREGELDSGTLNEIKELLSGLVGGDAVEVAEKVMTGKINTNFKQFAELVYTDTLANQDVDQLLRSVAKLPQSNRSFVLCGNRNVLLPMTVSNALSFAVDGQVVSKKLWNNVDDGEYIVLNDKSPSPNVLNNFCSSNPEVYCFGIQGSLTVKRDKNAKSFSPASNPVGLKSSLTTLRNVVNSVDLGVVNSEDDEMDVVVDPTPMTFTEL